jgi:hypothetical protein
VPEGVHHVGHGHFASGGPQDSPGHQIISARYFSNAACGLSMGPK